MSGFENVIYQWQRGERLLKGSPPERGAVLEAVTETLVAELRRRLGGKFSCQELAELYTSGTSWCLQVAMKVAPEEPFAWEEGVVVERGVQQISALGGRLRGRQTDTRRVVASCFQSSSPTRRMTILSSSIVTSTGRCPAQCSA